jgi:hypothetical protein
VGNGVEQPNNAVKAGTSASALRASFSPAHRERYTAEPETATKGRDLEERHELHTRVLRRYWRIAL